MPGPSEADIAAQTVVPGGTAAVAKGAVQWTAVKVVKSCALFVLAGLAGNAVYELAMDSGLLLSAATKRFHIHRKPSAHLTHR